MLTKLGINDSTLRPLNLLEISLIETFIIQFYRNPDDNSSSRVLGLQEPVGSGSSGYSVSELDEI
jgi:hypothetical protein